MRETTACTTSFETDRIFRRTLLPQQTNQQDNNNMLVIHRPMYNLNRKSLTINQLYKTLGHWERIHECQITQRKMMIIHSETDALLQLRKQISLKQPHWILIHIQWQLQDFIRKHKSNKEVGQNTELKWYWPIALIQLVLQYCKQ